MITRRTLASTAMAVVALMLTGCASGVRQVAGPTPDRCDMALARDGVVVTARGTRLALRPSSAFLQRVSLKTDQAGSAVLSCRPQGGVLTRCVVLYEDPGGQRLGKRALGYVDRVIYPSDVDDGVTAEVRFRFDDSAQGPRTCR